MTRPLSHSLSNLPLIDCILQGKCAVKTHVLAILLALTGLTSTASAVDSFFINLGTLGGDAYVSAISGDDSVVVGDSENASGNDEAFVWTQAGGMVNLGSLGGEETYVSGVSADGSVAVGKADNGDDTVAFLWDNVNGMRDLRGVLVADYSLASSLAGWDYLEAIEVSADGLTIVGNGEFEENDRVWIARIDSAVVPEPSSLILLVIALACLFGNARLRV